jgi:hypothetical protein
MGVGAVEEIRKAQSRGAPSPKFVQIDVEALIG